MNSDPLTYMIGVSLFILAVWMLRECIRERDTVRFTKDVLALVGIGLASIVLTTGGPRDGRVDWFMWAALAFLLAAGVIGLSEDRLRRRGQAGTEKSGKQT